MNYIPLSHLNMRREGHPSSWSQLSGLRKNTAYRCIAQRRRKLECTNWICKLKSFSGRGGKWAGALEGCSQQHGANWGQLASQFENVSFVDRSLQKKRLGWWWSCLSPFAPLPSHHWNCIHRHLFSLYLLDYAWVDGPEATAQLSLNLFTCPSHSVKSEW